MAATTSNGPPKEVASQKLDSVLNNMNRDAPSPDQPFLVKHEVTDNAEETAQAQVAATGMSLRAPPALTRKTGSLPLTESVSEALVGGKKNANVHGTMSLDAKPKKNDNADDDIGDDVFPDFLVECIKERTKLTEEITVHRQTMTNLQMQLTRLQQEMSRHEADMEKKKALLNAIDQSELERLQERAEQIKRGTTENTNYTLARKKSSDTSNTSGSHGSAFPAPPTTPPRPGKAAASQSMTPPMRTTTPQTQQEHDIIIAAPPQPQQQSPPRSSPLSWGVIEGFFQCAPSHEP